MHEPPDSSWLVRVGCRGRGSIDQLSATLHDVHGDLFIAALVRALVAMPRETLESYDKGVLALIDVKVHEIATAELRSAVSRHVATRRHEQGFADFMSPPKVTCDDRAST